MGTLIVVSVIVVFVLVVGALETHSWRVAQRRMESVLGSYDPKRHEGAGYGAIVARSNATRNASIGG